MNAVIQEITFKMVVAFVVGILSGQVLNWILYRRRMAKDPDSVVKRNNWEAVTSLTIIATMIWVMVSTQQARNCAINLNVAVGNEQAVAKIEREAFQTAIQKSLQLPPQILALPQNDPVRQAATKPITDAYLEATANAAELRKKNQIAEDAARKACGTQ